jgi:hypothetical protein
MDTTFSEQALRRVAVARYATGERPCDICRDFQRSRQWLNKWWNEFYYHPKTDFSDHSRAPHTSPHKTPVKMERAIVAVRQAREAGRTPQTRFGLIGSPTIQSDLKRLGYKEIPSVSTIQRILSTQGLTHPSGVSEDTAEYPWPLAWAPNAIHATDIITRHLRGGQAIQNIHTIDHYSHAVYLSQQLTKTSATICQFLRESWAKLGLPFFHQTDNEGIFSGGHTHRRVLGQVVRLCLFCGVEPIFIPEYEAKRNYQIETFHGLWSRGFWSQDVFSDLNDVQTNVPYFTKWYHTDYCPPALKGKTPHQMRQTFQPFQLTSRLDKLIPAGRLPITTGRIHVIRKMDGQGTVTLFNEAWSLHKKWIGEYVWMVIDTAQQQIDFWHLPESDAEWIHLKTRAFHLEEPVQKLLPEFYRNRQRCRERSPG